MKNVNFPIFKTKTEGVGEKFNLNNPDSRRKYFTAKASEEIKKLREYLDSGKTFVAYLIGKKNSGKGTYSKLFIEAIASRNVSHVSVGDIVRDVHAGLSDPIRKKEIVDFLTKNYRGFHTLEEIIAIIEGRDQSSLISTELTLALLKYEISRRPRQALFIDGFPRGLDQIGYSIFLKELLGYRDDPDFFVFIDLPEEVIDARIKTRVVCPVCKTPRNTRLAITKEIGYDEDKKAFYLVCDEAACKGARMTTKEGDELGIEPIRKRLETDDAVARNLLNLKGVPHIFLRNSIPVSDAQKVTDDYELTPSYSFEIDGNKNINPHTKTTIDMNASVSHNSPFGVGVKVIETPWTVKDDDGVESYSLMPSAVTISLIKQIAKVLGL